MPKFSTARLAPNDTPSLTGDPKSLATIAPADSDTSLATTAWVQAAIAGFSSGASVTIGATPPVSPSVGAMWWDTTSGQLFIWYNDGTSSQWVIANNPTSALIPSNPRVLLQRVDPVGTPYAVLGPFSTDYQTFEIDAQFLCGATDVAAFMQYSTDNGATWLGSGYHHAYNMGTSNGSGAWGGAASGSIQITPIGTTGVQNSVNLKLFRPWQNGIYHTVLGHSSGWASSGVFYLMTMSGAQMANTVPVTHVRLYNGAPNNFGAGGFVDLYGLR